MPGTNARRPITWQNQSFGTHGVPGPTYESLLEELRWRGFLSAVTADDLDTYLNEAPRTIYVGFDPTADSLHLGSLIPVMGLAHAQRHGHRPLVLVGGGTALIGDPSGKSLERTLLTASEVERNAAAVRGQLSCFFDVSSDERGAHAE